MLNLPGCFVPLSFKKLPVNREMNNSLNKKLGSTISMCVCVHVSERDLACASIVLVHGSSSMLSYGFSSVRMDFGVFVKHEAF